MRKKLNIIGQKSKKAFSLNIETKKKNKVLKDYCLLLNKKKKLIINQIITKDDEIIVQSQVHLVFVNKDGKPVKIPDEIYSKFKPYFCDTIKV